MNNLCIPDEDSATGPDLKIRETELSKHLILDGRVGLCGRYSKG